MAEADTTGRCGESVSAIRERSDGRLDRLAVVSLHTSPTASLGIGGNGGMNVYVREVCAALARDGVSSDIFTARAGLSPTVEQLSDGVRVIHLPVGDPNEDKYALADRVPEFVDRVERFVAENGLRYDFIYSHYWLSGLAACCLKPELGTPWAHTAHTLAAVKNGHLATGAKPEPEFRIRAEVEIARAADLLIASTERERDELVDLHGARRGVTEVIAPGVDLSHFQPRGRELSRAILGLPEGRLLLFVGRLERLKGVEIALRALALLNWQHPDLRLLIIGEDSRDAEESEKARLQELAAELGVQARAHFLGTVPHDELAFYYSAAEACLMPSYTESFGLVGLEALACGCPVIASDRTGLASVVEDGVTGLLVPDDQPESYARRIGRILEDPEAAAQLGDRGAQLAERSSWTQTARRIRAALERALAA